MQLWTLVPHATLNPTPEQLAAYRNLHPGGPDFPHAAAAEIFSASVTDLDKQIAAVGLKVPHQNAGRLIH